MVGDTAAARDWILGLPAGTWFTPGSVPAPKPAVNNLLVRLLNEDLPVIGRASRGLYWRQPPPATGFHGQQPVIDAACLSVAAPAGSGYADWGALYALRWSTQRPVRVVVVVPYRNLTPPVTTSSGDQWTYVHRPNPRRRDLNWNEATLLEGALAFGGSNLGSFEHATDRLLNAECYLKPHTPIHMSKVLWAAQTEKPMQGWPAGQQERSFAAVIEQLAADLPEAVTL